MVQEIRSTIEAAGGDAVAANKGQSRLVELKIQVDSIETIVHQPSIIAKLLDWLKDLKVLAADHGSSSQKQKAMELSSQVDEAIRRKDAECIEKKQKDVESLYFSILFAQPSFWVNQFRHLETEKSKMNDQAKAARLFDMGRNYISQNNTDGLKQIVQQLWNLTPDDVVNNAQRGFGANLAR